MIRLPFPSHFRSPHLIAALVCDRRGVSLAQIFSRDLARNLSSVRQDLTVLLSEFTGLTQAQIGTALGGRSETTVSKWLRQGGIDARQNAAEQTRMDDLRTAVLCLPGEQDGGSAPAAPAELARDVVQTGRARQITLEQLAISVVAATEVLRLPDLTPEEARHAALCLLSTQGAGVPRAAEIIPLKGLTK